MATALGLTAAATLINGTGLAANANVISQVSTFQSQGPIQTLQTIYSTLNSSAVEIRSNLNPLFSSLADGDSPGRFLLDMYPYAVTPTCSGNVVYGLTSPLITRTASVSKTFLVQANIPFVNGMAGFANVYNTVNGHAQSSFDSVASVHMLQNKSYKQSGLGYTNPKDLATGGLGANARVLANAISGFGTMYDIKNINNIGDPYVFGQNLLNQGFGQYGNLTVNVTAAGLDPQDITRVPQSATTTSQTSGQRFEYTQFGLISMPTTNNVSTTTTVYGNSPTVMVNIYKQVTGANLAMIKGATNVSVPSTSTITSLADYLDIHKVISANTVSQLGTLGITSLNGLGQYLQFKLSGGIYESWTKMAEFLRSIEVPQLSQLITATPNSAVLSSNTISTLTTGTTGSGPLSNLIPNDYLGAASGDPHTRLWKTVNAGYSEVAASVGIQGLVNTLKSAVDQYIADYNAYLASYEIDPESGIGSYTLPLPTTAAVAAAIAAITSALAGMTVTSTVGNVNIAYTSIINRVASEVSKLSAAGAAFDAGRPQTLRAFAESIGSTASDKDKMYTYQFFGNIITHDASGDKIKLAVAETINNRILAGRGIQVTTDPQPTLAIYQASAQNIPLNTYISRNQ